MVSMIVSTTAIMVLRANLPIALSYGIGMNAYFTYNVVGSRGDGNFSYGGAFAVLLPTVSDRVRTDFDSIKDYFAVLLLTISDTVVLTPASMISTPSLDNMRAISSMD